MVHLKYGEDQAISTNLIKEAGSALGRWMAANRRAGGKSGGVNDISREYLGAAPVSQPHESSGLSGASNHAYGVYTAGRLDRADELSFGLITAGRWQRSTRQA